MTSQHVGRGGGGEGGGGGVVPESSAATQEEENHDNLAAGDAAGSQPQVNEDITALTSLSGIIRIITS